MPKPPLGMPEDIGDGEVIGTIQHLQEKIDDLVNLIEQLPHAPDWEEIIEHRPTPEPPVDDGQTININGEDGGNIEVDLETGEINISDGDGNDVNINDGVVTYPDGNKEPIGEDGIVIQDPDGDKDIVIDGDGTVHVPGENDEIVRLILRARPRSIRRTGTVRSTSMTRA